MVSTVGSETATLAGGCFWCLETVFNRLKGVEGVIPGYTGGHLPEPTYEQVCTGTTGHAEAVQITYDPAVITYRDLLEVFFSLHDPTTPDRQGSDVGTQYRSAIFHHTPGQRETARAFMAHLEAEGVFDAPLVTELSPLGSFFSAENYHHGYYERNSQQPYCRTVISPKVAKLRQAFTTRLKEEGEA